MTNTITNTKGYTNRNTNVDKTRKIPSIKYRDTRCSRGCIQNWYKFKQQPPVYQICNCNKSHFNFNRYEFNVHLLKKSDL